LALLAILLGVGCGGPQKLGDPGSKCFRDDDCEAGLICVAPTAGDVHRVCSSDATPIISMVDAPEPIATGGNAGAAAGMNAGGTTTAGSGTAGSTSGAPASAGSGVGATAGTAAGGTDAAGTTTGGGSGSGAGGTSSGGTDTGETSDGGAP